jgi:anti-anti-sigma factor
MKTFTQDDTLLVTQFKNLGADNAFLFREFVGAALNEAHRYVDVDLATSEYVDSEGLGALIATHKRLSARAGQVRLLNPKPTVEEFFRLLKLDTLFPVLRR